MTHPTDPAADAVCICGHPRSNHAKPEFGEFCMAAVSWHKPCPCERFVDKDDLTAIDIYEKNAVANADAPAPDPEAAQLRERLAEAERERDEAIAECKGLAALYSEVVITDKGILQIERDLARAEAADLRAQVATWQEREAKVCPEDFSFEEVIGSLKGQLATWMDNYNAAKLAEGEAFQRGYEAARAQAIDICKKWSSVSLVQNGLYKMQPAPRPDTEAE